MMIPSIFYDEHDFCRLAQQGYIAIDDPCFNVMLLGDSGSTRTSVAVAVVDQCYQRVQLCDQYRLMLSYVNESKTNEGYLSDTFLTEFVTSIQNAVTQAQQHYPALDIEQSCIIATAGLRHVKNSADATHKLQAMLPGLFHPVTQWQEGVIAFHGVTAKMSMPSEDVMVMDLGGASKQITWVDENGSYQVVGLSIASATFLHKLQSTPGLLTKDVYPLNADTLEAVYKLAYAEIKILPQVPTHKHVIGVGGHRSVAQHFSSVLAGALAGYYTVTHLEDALTKLAQYTLPEVMAISFNKHVFSTEQIINTAKLSLSGMVLILAALKHLGIEKVHTGHDNNVAGLAVLRCELPLHHLKSATTGT